MLFQSEGLVDPALVQALKVDLPEFSKEIGQIRATVYPVPQSPTGYAIFMGSDRTLEHSMQTATSQPDPNTPPEARRRYPAELDEYRVAQQNEAALADRLEAAELRLSETRTRVQSYESRPGGTVPEHEREALARQQAEVTRLGVERDRARAEIVRLREQRAAESAQRDRQERIQKRLDAAQRIMAAPSAEPAAQAAVDAAQKVVDSAQAAVDAAADRVREMKRRRDSQGYVYTEQLRAHRDLVVQGKETPADAPKLIDWSPYLNRATSDRAAADAKLRTAHDQFRRAQEVHRETIAADAVREMWPHIVKILELAPDGSWPIPEAWRDCAVVQLSPTCVQITIPREAPLSDD